MKENLPMLEKALEEAMAKGDRMRARGIADAIEDIMRNEAASAEIADVASRAKVSTPRYLKDKIKQGPGDALDFPARFLRLAVHPSPYGICGCQFYHPCFFLAFTSTCIIFGALSPNR